MKFEELINRLGIASYPDRLKEVLDGLGEDDGRLCDAEYIKDLHARYGLLGEYLDDVLRGAEAVKRDEACLLYGRAVVEYNRTSGSYEARQIKMPDLNGDLARDFLPVLIFLATVPETVEKYEARGFDGEQIKKNLDNLRINIWVVELLIGRPALDQGHYNWLCHYMMAMIFDHKAFNFQPAVWGTNAIYLKNKKSGEVVPMMTAGRFHKSGLVLGSAGCTDEDGAFSADFIEVSDLFVGHLVRNGRVEAKLSSLKRDEWECILRPGDDVISLHIPRNTNLSPEYVVESIREGFELSAKYYPELKFKFVICHSWLLEPKLADILGEGAKLTFFTTRFMKYPVFDRGTACLGYVYPGYHTGPVECFPENTTLQRGIKKLMLEGDFIRGTAGVIIDL